LERWAARGLAAFFAVGGFKKLSLTGMRNVT
jgi:hypothetical protein